MHLFIYLVLVAYLVPVVPVIGNNKFCLQAIDLFSLIFCKPLTDIIMLIIG